MKPIVCICWREQVCGIVLKADLDAATEAYWAERQNFIGPEGTIPLVVISGERIPIPPEKIFYFGRHSQTLVSILRECFVQQSIFNIAMVGYWDRCEYVGVPNDTEEGLRARAHLFSQT